MKKFHLKDFLWGVFIALFVVTPAIILSGALKPSPYSKVRVVEVTIEEQFVTLTANFVKNDACTFQTLAVFGETLGRWSPPLDWADAGTPAGDRLAGSQTLNILIGSLDTHYDKLEVRTRHLCGDAKIDRVFTTIKLK